MSSPTFKWCNFSVNVLGKTVFYILVVICFSNASAQTTIPGMSIKISEKLEQNEEPTKRQPSSKEKDDSWREGADLSKPTVCEKEFVKYKSSFKDLVTDYAQFLCHPLKALEALKEKHPKKKWIFEALTKKNYSKPLNIEEELNLKTQLYPYIKNKNLREKSLLDQINFRTKLGLDISNEKQQLHSNFPSHDPAQLKLPRLKLVKDLRRRGLDKKALEMLIKLKKKYPSGNKVHKSLIATQKNISRDKNFLKYSQNYTDIVYKRYKQNKKNKWKRRDYLKHGLLNIRRIWTYRSTNEALKRLKVLITYHCKFDTECSEHYWILGRIYDEKKDFSQSRVWLKKSMDATPEKSSEYIHRLWNLLWLESKSISKEKALETAKAYTYDLKAKDVSSKIYFWMSRWTESEKEKAKYESLIEKHHPLSFYLWSPLAMGKGIKLKKTQASKLSVKTKHEKELFLLTKSNFPNLTRTYISTTEKIKPFKKSLTWKTLKALNGMYADLLLDLEAENISPKSHLSYLFSTKYENIIEKKALEFKIPKVLIWSIIRQESNFNPYAKSWADAYGLMQVLEKRALSYLAEKQNLKKENLSPIEMYDPSFNISVGSWLLESNLKELDNKLSLSIAAYNANINKVKSWKERFYKNDDVLTMIEEITYRETRKYVKLVLRNMEIYNQISN